MGGCEWAGGVAWDYVICGEWVAWYWAESAEVADGGVVAKEFSGFTVGGGGV